MTRKRMLFSRLRTLHAVIALGGIICLYVMYIFLWTSPVQTMTTVVIDDGATVSGVATRLKSSDLIDSVGVFKTAVKLHGGRVQRGMYDIPRGASAFRIARMMARGDVASVNIVIPEGLTVRQIKNLLLGSAALTGPVDCSDSENPVCDLHDGDLFPDTYRVARGTRRLAVLELMRKKMVRIHDNWLATGRRAPAVLHSWNDIVTLASIVQKETPRAAEMPIVASVYLNRLKKKMRLQADPTVVYALTGGLGDMGGRALLRGHLKVDSPYNTYVHYGLPPAPIANVGRNAITAVLNPADTNYLYFVADGSGGHRFADTYEIHQKNHADWRAIKKIKNKK